MEDIWRDSVEMLNKIPVNKGIYLRYKLVQDFLHQHGGIGFLAKRPNMTIEILVLAFLLC